MGWKRRGSTLGEGGQEAWIKPERRARAWMVGLGSSHIKETMRASVYRKTRGIPTWGAGEGPEGSKEVGGPRPAAPGTLGSAAPMGAPHASWAWGPGCREETRRAVLALLGVSFQLWIVLLFNRSDSSVMSGKQISDHRGSGRVGRVARSLPGPHRP